MYYAPVTPISEWVFNSFHNAHPLGDWFIFLLKLDEVFYFASLVDLIFAECCF